ISTEPSWKGTYNRLFTYVVLGEFIFYGMSAGAVILLRHTAADMPRPYRTWGYPVTPFLFVLFSVWLIWNTAHEQLLDFAVGMALILAGLPWYWWRKASSVIRHPSTAATDNGSRTTDDVLLVVRAGLLQALQRTLHVFPGVRVLEGAG